MKGIRCAKEKVRMIAARPTRYATLAVVVVIQGLIGTRTAFGADQVHDEIQVYSQPSGNGPISSI